MILGCDDDRLRKSSPKMRYFHKAMISNPAFTSAGSPIIFQHVGGDDGIIATDNQTIIDALVERIQKRKGGVSELTEEQYAELQKKKTVLPSPQRQRLRQGVEPLAVLPQDPVKASIKPPAAPAAVAVAEVNQAKPSSEPSRPQTGRLKK